MTMDREGVIQKFRKKQKHIRNSKKWGKKKKEDIRNRRIDVVEAITSIFTSFGSRCSSVAIPNSQQLSQSSLAFVNRYKKLSKIHNNE